MNGNKISFYFWTFLFMSWLSLVLYVGNLGLPLETNEIKLEEEDWACVEWENVKIPSFIDGELSRYLEASGKSLYQKYPLIEIINLTSYYNTSFTQEQFYDNFCVREGLNCETRELWNITKCPSESGLVGKDWVVRDECIVKVTGACDQVRYV